MNLRKGAGRTAHPLKSLQTNSMTLVDLKSVEVVAGLILRRGKALVCQRKKTASFALKWEFPGGKVKDGEGYEAALRRELKEELGIEARGLTEIFHHKHVYRNVLKVNLRFFRVRDYSGRVRNLVFQRILWLAIDELSQLDFLEADLPLIGKLSLPGGKQLLT